MAKETAVNIIQQVIEKVCDEYCRYNYEFNNKDDDSPEAEEELYKKHCDSCILNKLF